MIKVSTTQTYTRELLEIAQNGAKLFCLSLLRLILSVNNDIYFQGKFECVNQRNFMRQLGVFEWSVLGTITEQIRQQKSWQIHQIKQKTFRKDKSSDSFTVLSGCIDIDIFICV